MKPYLFADFHSLKCASFLLAVIATGACGEDGSPPVVDAAVGGTCGSLDLEPYRSGTCFCGSACACFLDVPYGPATWTEGGQTRAQTLDLFMPAAGGADRAFVMWAHPNGQNKAVSMSGAIAQDVALPALAEGYVFASVEFRHPETNESIGAPQTDIAHAIQFVRCYSDALGIAPARVAVVARSRGTLSIWTALQDDMADPDDEDPLRRMSTRIRGVYAVQAQTSYWGEWIAETFFDAASQPLVLASVGPENHGHAVGDVTRDDPPVMISYEDPLETLPIAASGCKTLGNDDGIDCVHLPNFGDELQKAYIEAGIGDRITVRYSVPTAQLFDPAMERLRTWLAP